MAYDLDLAERANRELSQRVEVIEKKMFGGLAMMVSGHMVCGIVGDELMLRTGPDGYQEALERPHARPMDFTGREMRGFVIVAAEACDDPDTLREWLMMALDFVLTLPPKA